MAGDDARDIFSVLNGDAQRLFTLPDDLVGDGRPNQGHDDGNGRHQLDPNLADGRRTHTSGNGPSGTPSRYASLWSTSTERTTSRHKGRVKSSPAAPGGS